MIEPLLQLPPSLSASLPASSDPDSPVELSSKKTTSSPASEPGTVESSPNESSPESDAYELDESGVVSFSPPPDPEELAPELP